MSAFRWDFHGEEVLEQVAKAPDEVREDFVRLMERLTRNPRDERAGVQRLMVPPGGYTAPFDGGLLVYEVLANYPRIRLTLVRWNQGG